MQSMFSTVTPFYILRQWMVTFVESRNFHISCLPTPSSPQCRHPGWLGSRLHKAFATAGGQWSPAKSLIPDMKCRVVEARNGWKTNGCIVQPNVDPTTVHPWSFGLGVVPALWRCEVCAGGVEPLGWWCAFYGVFWTHSYLWWNDRYFPKPSVCPLGQIQPFHVVTIRGGMQLPPNLLDIFWEPFLKDIFSRLTVARFCSCVCAHQCHIFLMSSREAFLLHISKIIKHETDAFFSSGRRAVSCEWRICSLCKRRAYFLYMCTKEVPSCSREPGSCLHKPLIGHQYDTNGHQWARM